MTDTDHVESGLQVPAPSQAVPQVAVPQAAPQVYPHNFPLPHAMKCHGDVMEMSSETGISSNSGGVIMK